MPGSSIRPGSSIAPRRARRRARWLTRGVPIVLGGGAGISAFMVLAVASLIGGAGILSPLLGGLAVGLAVGGGLAVLLRNRAPRHVRPSDLPELTETTRTMLVAIAKSSARGQKHAAMLRRRLRQKPLRPALDRADGMLQRVSALLGSPGLASRHAADDAVMTLEGMTSRYIPELLGAIEANAPALASSDEATRRAGHANLLSIERQLGVLEGQLDQLDAQLVRGVTRSLDVHEEFLSQRFYDPRIATVGAAPLSEVLQER